MATAWVRPSVRLRQQADGGRIRGGDCRRCNMIGKLLGLHQFPQPDGAHQSAAAILHGKRADIVLEEQSARLLRGGVLADRDHIARHDIGTADSAVGANGGLDLDLPQQAAAGRGDRYRSVSSNFSSAASTSSSRKPMRVADGGSIV